MGRRLARTSARSAIIWAACGGVVEQGAQGGGDVGGGEVVVEQFGDDAAAGDEVDHGDGEVAVGVGLGGDFGGVADEAFGEGEVRGETR